MKDEYIKSDLSKAVFRKPTAEYRAVPFWAWNCRLEREELERQIEIFKKMGMGGVMVHARNGLDTPYMQDEFMQLVESSIQKAKSEGLFAWLYDEDRWPSGDAGHQVTKNPKYKIRVAKITPVKESAVEKEEAFATGKPYLLSLYGVCRNEKGELLSYRRLARETDCAAHEKLFYAYCQCVPDSYYVDTLSKEAIDCFIALTHERYKDLCGEEFGKTVPSIFTDEPQFSKMDWLPTGTDDGPVCMPWTVDLPESYAAFYHADILDTLPELFWDKAEGEISLARYRYHNHVTDRFVEAFADNIGSWCEDNGIALSGHMMCEQALWTQTGWIGEAMRSYRSFQIPGIDMLCDWREYSTAVQAKSSAHQYGRTSLLSELYGVTNWDFDFRGHKLQGDWQAALGVTVRVPHLSWVSMHGEAKRDYPASIGYQAPWHEKYSLVEDHFARVNTAMTRGEPVVDVAVIHPIESYWLYWGPKRENGAKQASLEENFQAITDWLLFGNIDFDFLSEDSLPALYKTTSDGLQVGAMNYKTVIISGCETLRKTTVEILLEFVWRGGDVLFVGKAPTLVDAQKEDLSLLEALYARSRKEIMDRRLLLEAVKPCARVEILDASGLSTNRFLYQLRKDQRCWWLFVAHGRSPDFRDTPAGDLLTIRIQGRCKPELYRTQDGAVEPLPYTYVTKQDGTVWTDIRAIVFRQDSLLIRLNPVRKGYPECAGRYNPYEMKGERLHTFYVKDACQYKMSEPNVLLLDTAEYAWDDGDWNEEEELLRVGTKMQQLFWPDRPDRQTMQPYMIPDEPCAHTLRLRMKFQSRVTVSNCKLALEDAARVMIRFNGERVPSAVSGYFTDKAIQTVNLPSIRKGQNVLELCLPINYKSCVEWCYILGDFGVQLEGVQKILVTKPKRLSFASLTKQGYPFYGANVTYKTVMHVPGEAGTYRDLLIKVPRYRGAMIDVSVDGKHKGNIIYAPYCLKIPHVSPGEHTISFTCYGNRYNSFGPLHMCDETRIWFGPDSWYTQGDAWTYDYMLKETGILLSPVIEVYDEK